MHSSDLLIQTLANLGTKNIFALSGNQVMPIFDACIGSGIQLIHVRHESAAVHMADAWGRLTGQPGVALVPAGPGFANALSASYVAHMAESPVVVLSGHAPLATLSQGAFQEMAQVEMATAVSKASWLVKDPEQIGHDIQRAFHIAKNGRPGPVHLALPFDLLEVEVEVQPELISFEDKVQEVGEWVGSIKRALKVAKRPFFLAGPAIMRHPNFDHWVAQFAQMGLPLIGMASPRGVNDPSLGKFSAILKQADCLILLGKKLDFTLKLGQHPFISEGTDIYQIDHDNATLELTQKNGARLTIATLAQGDPIQAIQTVIQSPIPNSQSPDWLTEVQAALTYIPQEWLEYRSLQGEPLHSAEVGQVIDEHLAGEDAVFISDGGEFGQWMQAFVKTKPRIINGPSGSIGNAIPFALAARLAFPKAKIVACTGDGAFGFVPLEMDTAVRYNLPFTLVIGNDARWNAEVQIQKRNYGEDRVQDVLLNQTRYEKVVEALGGWGKHVSDVDDLQHALREAEQSNLPACLNVHIIGEAAPKLS